MKTIEINMEFSKELSWLMKAAKKYKEYPECVQKTFIGKLPYRMVMNAILKNKWTNISENNTYWSASNTDSQKFNYSIYYTIKTGVVEFSVSEAKTELTA